MMIGLWLTAKVASLEYERILVVGDKSIILIGTNGI